MTNFLINNIAFISFISALLCWWAIINDFMDDAEILGLPIWTFDILLFPIGVLRGLYLGLK